MKKQISEANHDSSNQLGSSNQHRGRKRLAFGVTLGSLLALAPTAHGYQLDSVEVALPNEAAVVLSTDVYRPDVEDPAGRPTILRRGPYGKQNNISTGDVTHIVDVLGYNLVVQDVRGRWDSTGEYLPFLNAREDGAYMVDWIVGHSWSDGQVATSGVSALGITQYMMASEASDALKCQAVAVAASSMYHDTVRSGGGYRQSLVEGWLEGLRDQHDDETGAVGGETCQVFEAIDAAPFFGDDFWQRTEMSNHWGDINVPTLHVAGWYDVFTEGNLRAFEHVNAEGGEGARGKQWLLVGPWTHATTLFRQQGQLKYPADSTLLHWGGLEDAWHSYCLEGNENTLFSNSDMRVAYYVMGDPQVDDDSGNEWRFASAWPPEPITEQHLYLNRCRALTSSTPGPNVPADGFVSDPLDPVPTIGGANLKIPAGPYDQREAERRDDVIVYTTAELAGPVTVIGSVQVQLQVSADTPDADFAVRLTDVYPDGRSMLVKDGLARARHRNSFDSEDWLQGPDDVVSLTVDLGQTALVFSSGHRIRISISGTNAPRFAPNPNTGAAFSTAPIGYQLDSPKTLGRFFAAGGGYSNPMTDCFDGVPSQETAVASCNVYRDALRASAIILPVTSGAEHLQELDSAMDNCKPQHPGDELP